MDVVGKHELDFSGEIFYSEHFHSFFEYIYKFRIFLDFARSIVIVLAVRTNSTLYLANLCLLPGR